MINDTELLEQWWEHKDKSIQGLRRWKDEAKESYALEAGDKDYYTASVMDKGRKAMVVFNRIKPVIDAVAGFFIQLRRKPEYLARRPNVKEQLLYSTYLNNVSDYVRGNCNADHIESKQDKDMLICGVGAIDTNIYYDKNPGGEICEENVPFDELWWDPMAQGLNAMDAKWVFRQKRLYLKEALEMFPDSSPSDFEPFNDSDYLNYQWNPVGGAWDKITTGADLSQSDLVSVYYYQWWDLKPYYRIKNPILAIRDPFMQRGIIEFMQRINAKRSEYLDEYEDDDEIEDMFSFNPTAEYLTMNETQYKDIRAMFKKLNDINPLLNLGDIEYVRHMRRCYYTAILTDRKVFKKFKSLDQNGFTIKFKTGDYDIVSHMYYGMVRQLKEPARYANKALTEILYVIAANSKGGVMYEQGAVPNAARFEQDWATTKSAIMVNAGALQKQQIQPKAQAALPSGYEQVYAMSTAAIGEISVNKEFLGTAENKQVSALFEQQRVQRASAALAGYLDNISLFQKEQARLMITFMRVWAQNDAGRPMRVSGETGSVLMLPLNERFMTEEYDIDIGEAPTTPEQNTQAGQLMMDTAQGMAQLGDLQGAKAMMSIAVDYIPIKESDKAKFKEAMNPQPTPEQIQAQQKAQEEADAIKQLTMESAKADITKTMADAHLKMAQTIKTGNDAEISKVDVNKTLAEILKIGAETDQKEAETRQIQSAPLQETRVVI